MSNFYNDGSYVNYGSVLLAVTGLAGSLLGNYVTENFSVTTPSDKIQIRDQANAPAGQVFVSGFINGNATLQCGKTGTPVPHNGSRFGFGGSVYVLSEIGDTRTQNDIVKASVSFDRVYN